MACSTNRSGDGGPPGPPPPGPMRPSRPPGPARPSRGPPCPWPSRTPPGRSNEPPRPGGGPSGRSGGWATETVTSEAAIIAMAAVLTILTLAIPKLSIPKLSIPKLSIPKLSILGERLITGSLGKRHVSTGCHSAQGEHTGSPSRPIIPGECVSSASTAGTGKSLAVGRQPASTPGVTPDIRSTRC